MEVSKNYKRKLKPQELKVPYGEFVEWEDDVFTDKAKRDGWGISEIEGFIYSQNCYWWGEEELSRLLDFVAIAYCELKYTGEITDLYKGELSLDIPVWDSGEVDKILDDDEKKPVHEHLEIIKKYLKNNPRK